MTAVSRRDSGFTLLEMLVSVTILSLIVVALTGGVHFAGNAWRAQELRNARQSDVNAVQSVLRQMLSSGKDFEGGSESLKFVGKLPAALARGGLFDIELYSDGTHLILSWRPHFKGPGKGVGSQQASLLDGIATLNFAYFMPDSGWQREASSKAKPLALISAQARMSNGRVWPPFVVTPATNVTAKPKT